MPYTIRFLEHPPLYPLDGKYFPGAVDFAKLNIGDMCYHHNKGTPTTDLGYLQGMHLTKYYFGHNLGRPPLILALPNHTGSPLYFLVDGQGYSGKCVRCGKDVHGKCKCPDPKVPKGYYDCWTVTGTPPVITVSPSVNYDDDERGIKHYHGFIKDGVIGNG